MKVNYNLRNCIIARSYYDIKEFLEEDKQFKIGRKN